MYTYRKRQLQEGIVEKYVGKTQTSMIIDPETGNVYVIANESDHLGGMGLSP
jgi:hypothetical protein